ncbi:MAG: substrate-binding domain-containing protein [Planctomycetota bacterium]|jgi:ribose transport system substrate-binding protein|nr:substrate-binding domain-containing protein [Planctomycetota bacterium]
MRKHGFTWVVLAVCAVAFVAAMPTGAVAGQKKTGGFVIGLSAANIGNTWCAQFVEDFENRAREYIAEGAMSDFQVASTNGNVTEQITQCLTMINNGVDALLVWPVSPTALQSVVDAAKANGVMIIMANEPGAYAGVPAIIGDNAEFQRIQAKWLVEQLRGEGEILQITGFPGFASDDLRQAAAAEVFADYPGIVTLASAPGNWSTTIAQQAMTTFLATYDDFDAVFSQDVMVEGILKAFENAEVEPEIMTGDYTLSFFKKWKAKPNLNSIGVTYQPGVIVTVLDFTIHLLRGKSIKKEFLVENPLNASMINTVYIKPAYVVTRDGDPDASWMRGLAGTKAISLDAVLEMLKDQSDTVSLDGWMSREEVAKFFE